MNSTKPGKLSSESYDLILVGTSFASSFFLKKYLELSSPLVRVLVLERGSFIPHQQRVEQARTLPYGKVSFISGGDARKTYNNQTEGKPWIFDPSFGGSSNCWTGCTPRFLPNDFKLQSKYNVGKDWPIDYEDLEPFYCEAENIMSISGPEKTPYPMSQQYPQPPHELSTVDKILQKDYGDLYISQPTARSSIAGKRNKCCTSAICHLCPVGAKFTIENGLSHLYDDARVEVMFQSQVLRLETANSLIQGVVYSNSGTEQTVKSGVVALGANPLFNAHILLNSGDSNPATGHFLSEQVGFYATVYLNGLRNTGGSSIITANGFMLSDTPDRSRQAACLIESHNDFFVRHEHRKWREVARFKFVFEDIPQFENCVSTSDKVETPLVSYHSHSDYVTRGYDHLKEKIQKLFNTLPVEEIYLDENPQASESHILGTTRMSPDAATGVIDKHLIHHQYRNLFVLGGSSFPSISPANPTLTLSALSLWSATKSFGPS